MSAAMAGPRLVTAEELDAALTPAAAEAAVREAFIAHSTGTALTPPAVGVELPLGEVHIKSAMLDAAGPLVVKVASGFPGNSRTGLPTGDGAMLALDPRTGAVTAVLLDRGRLTDLRTAAATAVALRRLAPRPPRRLAVLGTGVQARLTLEVLGAVGLLPPEVALWGRDPARARAAAERLGPKVGPAVAVAGTAGEAVTGADAVITVTGAREPVLSGGWLTDHAVVVAVGADTPGKRECDAEVMRRAAVLVVDDQNQAGRHGELQHARAEGTVPSLVYQLGRVLAERVELPTGVRVCDLTGLGVHDAAVARAALRAVAGDRRGSQPSG